MSGSEIARQIGASISGVNNFLRAFKNWEDLLNCYEKKCEEEGARFYQYSQYCEFYNR